MIVFDRKEKEIKVPEGLGNINLTVVDANLEDKTVEINEVETTILPSSGYNGMSSIQIDAQPVYDNGYNRGYNEGETDQKAKLTGITITENGTYSREDGYNEVVVDVIPEPVITFPLDVTLTENGTYNYDPTEYGDGYSSVKVIVDVPDLNGDYQTGYDEGYEAGIDYASENAGEIVAQTARVLDVTENGIYETQYSEPRLLTTITGIFPNGDNFYDYAKLEKTKYNTGVIPTTNTKIEMWYKPKINHKGYVIGTQYTGAVDSVFKIFINENNVMETALAGTRVDVNITNQWYHIEMSYADGLIIDGVKMGNYTANISGNYNVPFGINDLYDISGENWSNDGSFGMIKITTDGITNVFIPTEEGFKNYTTNEYLPLIEKLNLEYNYFHNYTGIYPNGEKIHSLGILNNNIYNTGIYINNNSIIEFWYKGDDQKTDDGWNQIINAESKSDERSFALAYTYSDNNKLRLSWGAKYYDIVWNDNVLNHLIISSNGVFLNDEKVVDIENTTFTSSVPCVINGIAFDLGPRRANGGFGMIKITTDGVENIIIPTEIGLRNITTDEMLEVVYNGGTYEYDNRVTGEYADGTLFYEYAEIKDYVYNTEILPNETTKLEFWFKRDNSKESWANVIAASEADNNSFRIRQYAPGIGVEAYVAQLKNSTITFNMTSQFWYHIEMSYAEGLIINDNKIGDFTENISQYTTAPIFINGGQLWSLPDGTDDGNFGMIKITTDGVENIIIPTESGLKNITTNKYLPIVNIPYIYIQVEPEYSKPTGNLIKTVNVNVPPKIDVKKYGIKLGYSTFAEVPDFYDFSNTTDMINMFANCGNLTKLPNGINGNIVTNWNSFMANTNITSIEPIDISLCINLNGMFENTKLTEIPYLDTSNATSMRAFLSNNSSIITIPELNTRKVQDMSNFFYAFGGNKNLVSLPKIYCDSCTSMGSYFSYYSDGMSSLTDVGGWINLKCNWDDRYGLPSCNNLTYQSCINILNGLYDFSGNGETPASNQGKLKVHPNFLTTVGDEISIAVAKGWSVSA